MKIEIYEMTKEELAECGGNECYACRLFGADCFNDASGELECIAAARAAGLNPDRSCFREVSE